MNFAIAELSIGEFILDNSTPNPFRELLKNPESELVYLIELMPFDDTITKTVTGQIPIGAGAIGEFDFNVRGHVITLYYSDKGFITKPSDTPSNQSYSPLAQNPFQFDVSVLNADGFNSGAGSFGAIRLANGDGALESLTDYFWVGRRVNIYVGSPDFTRDQFVSMFNGLCAGIEYNEDEIIINIQSRERILETEFAPTLYLGTGGLEGGADLQGSIKPIVYGECYRVSPVLVDPVNLVYQVHDGSVQEIMAVYDRGVLLTNHGDYADITAQSAPAGQYITQLSGGFIKLGSNNDGVITVDVKGDNQGGYVSKPAEVIARFLKTRLGQSSFTDSDIDLGSFNALDDELNADIGVYVRSNTTAKRFIDDILNPLQCYSVFNRDGQIALGVGKVPQISVLTLTENDIIDGELRVDEVSNPTWEVTMGYRRAWTVQGANDIATAASNDYKTFGLEEYRKVVLREQNVRTKSINAGSKELNSLLVNESDAITQGQRVQSLFNVKRKVYKITVRDLLFRVFIGDTLTLQLNRFGLENGKQFLVMGISEDGETGLTELEVWG